MAGTTEMNPSAGSSIVTSQRVRIGSDAVRVGAPVHTHGTTTAEPRVILVREEGIVRAIDVVCGCGERIRIRCDYA